MRTVNHVHRYQSVQLKSKFRHSTTALPPVSTTAVFLRHLSLTAFSFQYGKIRHAFQKFYFIFVLDFKLRKSKASARVLKSTLATQTAQLTELETRTFQMPLHATCLTVPPTLNHGAIKPSRWIQAKPLALGTETGRRLYDPPVPTPDEMAEVGPLNCSRLDCVSDLFERDDEKENPGPSNTKARSSEPQVPACSGRLATVEIK